MKDILEENRKVVDSWPPWKKVRWCMSWEDLEALYWRFDAMHKGYGEWSGTPTSERDAFKRTVKQAMAEKDKAYQQLMEKAIEFAKCLTGCPSPCTEADWPECRMRRAGAFLKERK